MAIFNIYLTGVGGQGIGLISEVILRAADHAGLPVKGVDTHGLAQRGGIVVSHIRIGEPVYSPLIPRGKADLVIALERHEALRGVVQASKSGGTLIYYNTVWQPLEVRVKNVEEVSEERISEICRQRGIREIHVVDDTLKEARMQNMVLLGTLTKEALIPEVGTDHYRQAMTDLMQGAMLASNTDLFDAHRLGP